MKKRRLWTIAALALSVALALLCAPSLYASTIAVIDIGALGVHQSVDEIVVAVVAENAGAAVLTRYELSERNTISTQSFIDDEAERSLETLDVRPAIAERHLTRTMTEDWRGVNKAQAPQASQLHQLPIGHWRSCPLRC